MYSPFQTLPKASSSSNLHCIVSPRFHHSKTFEDYNYNSPENRPNSLKHEYDTLKKQLFITRNPLNESHLNNISEFNPLSPNLTKTLNLNSYSNLNSYHNFNNNNLQSYLTQTIHNQINNQHNHNKFYSFKTIREQKCRQKNEEGKVIKSFKVNVQKKQENQIFLSKKKIIEHLDQVQTIVSTNSPRESLNSQNIPRIQQSQIIMRGADLYQDLVETQNQKQLGNSLFLKNSNQKNDKK